MTTELVRRSLQLALALLASSWLISCGSPSNQATIYIDEKKIPENMRSDYESFVVNCSKCHSLSRAFNANVTDPMHWDLYVARMMRTAGSSISPSEKPHILRFLHWYTEKYVPAEKAAGEDNEQSPEVVADTQTTPARESSAPVVADPAPVEPEAPPTASEAPAAVVPSSAPPPTSEVPATPPAEDE